MGLDQSVEIRPESPGVVSRTRQDTKADIKSVRNTKTIDLPQVNTVLLQPHWRRNQTVNSHPLIVFSPSISPN